MQRISLYLFEKKVYKSNKKINEVLALPSERL